MKTINRSIGFKLVILCLTVFALARCQAPPSPIPKTGGDSTALPAMSMFPVAKTACVTGDDAPVRENPSVDAAMTGTLARGAKVQARGQTVNQQWYRVDYQAAGKAQSGWVASAFITLSDTCGPATPSAPAAASATAKASATKATALAPLATPSPTLTLTPSMTVTPRPTQPRATATNTPKPIVHATTPAPVEPARPSQTPSATDKPPEPYNPPTPTDRPTVVPLPTDTTPPILRVTIVWKTRLPPLFLPTPTWTSPPTGVPPPPQTPGP